MPWMLAAASISAGVSYLSAQSNARRQNAMAEIDYIRNSALARYEEVKQESRNRAVDIAARERYNALEISMLSRSAKEVEDKKKIQEDAIRKKGQLAVMRNFRGINGRSIDRIEREIDASKNESLFMIERSGEEQSLMDIYSARGIEEARISGIDNSLFLTPKPNYVNVGDASLVAGITSLANSAVSYMESL